MRIQGDFDMRPYSFLLVFLAPVLTIAGIQVGGIWTFATAMLAFGAIPLVELIVRPQSANLSESQERDVLANPWYDVVVYAAVPVQYGVIFHLLYVMSTNPLSGYELGGAIFSTGICCGALGINVAHELGHRRKPAEQAMAKALLLTSLYMHWLVEHLKGHHARVSTKEDPASARHGENVYAFLLRSITTSYVSAWQLEAKRLRTLKKSPFSLENSVLKYHLIEAAFLIGVFSYFGTLAGMSFVGAAVVGFVLLEVVNYIEHYGLERQHNGTRYEKVRPVHSWNSNHVMGRCFLFNLSRHSDHHANASRHYQILRHYEESPQMPTGYPGMMMLALVPPLWFAIMHPQVSKHKEQLLAA